MRFDIWTAPYFRRPQTVFFRYLFCPSVLSFYFLCSLSLFKLERFSRYFLFLLVLNRKIFLIFLESTCPNLVLWSHFRWVWNIFPKRNKKHPSKSLWYLVETRAFLLTLQTSYSVGFRQCFELNSRLPVSCPSMPKLGGDIFDIVESLKSPGNILYSLLYFWCLCYYSLLRVKKSP